MFDAGALDFEVADGQSPLRVVGLGDLPVALALDSEVVGGQLPLHDVGLIALPVALALDFEVAGGAGFPSC